MRPAKTEPSLQTPYDIEFAPRTIAACSCCGEQMVNLTRFVSRGDVPYAVYRASIVKGRAHRGTAVAVSLGDFTDQEDIGRVMFVCRLWLEQEAYELSFIGAELAPWPSGKLGRILEPEEARQHPLLGDFQSLMSFVIERDDDLLDQL